LTSRGGFVFNEIRLIRLFALLLLKYLA